MAASSHPDRPGRAIPWRAVRASFAIGLALHVVAASLMKLTEHDRHGASACPGFLLVPSVLWLFLGSFVFFGARVGQWLRRQARPGHDAFPWALPWLALYVVLELSSTWLLWAVLPSPSPDYMIVAVDMHADASPEAPSSEAWGYLLAGLGLCVVIACWTIPLVFAASCEWARPWGRLRKGTGASVRM